MNLVDKKDINKELQELENAEIFKSKETTHSMVIAYLLLKEPEFLEKFFDKIGLSILNLEKNLIIQTEANHIDILIKNENSIVAIENKYKDRCRKNDNETTLEPDQLKRYENYINEKAIHLEKSFIYLRPFQHKLDENYKNWKSLTYKNILDILNSLKTNSEQIDRYKKIIEKIYEPQEICKNVLNEVLNLNNTDSIEIDDERGDINGYAIRIPLSGNYNSFLELEHPYPFCDYRDKVTINLTVKKSDITECDYILLKNVRDEQGRKRFNGDKNYTWCSEEICKNKDFSEEVVREKLQNSKIIEALKKNHIFDMSQIDALVC